MPAERQISASRIGLVAAAVMTVATILQLGSQRDAHDTASYGAGYAAASDSALVREAVAGAHVGSSQLCDELVDHALAASDHRTLVRDDFVSGCRHAIGDAME